MEIHFKLKWMQKMWEEERIVDSYLVHEAHPELSYFSDTIINVVDC